MKKIIFVLSVIMMMLGNAISLLAQIDSTKTDTSYHLGFWKGLCMYLLTEKKDFYKPVTSYEIHPSKIPDSSVFIPVTRNVKVISFEDKPNFAVRNADTSYYAEPDSAKVDTSYHLGFWQEKGWVCIYLSIYKTDFYKPIHFPTPVPRTNTVSVTYSESKPYVKLVPGLADISQQEINSLFSRDSVRRIIRKPQFNLWHAVVGEETFFLKEKLGNPLTDLKYEIKKKPGRNLPSQVVSHILFFLFILFLYLFISSFFTHKYEYFDWSNTMAWLVMTLICGCSIWYIYYFINNLIYINILNLVIFSFFLILFWWQRRRKKMEIKNPPHAVSSSCREET